MNTTQKIIAKSVLLKCINSRDWENKDEDLISTINNFQTLDAFVEYIVLSKNAPLYCLPSNYIQNKNFLMKMLNKKQSLINEIYQLNNAAYRKIVRELDLKKFLKRCKFALLPQIKRDINLLLSTQQNQDEVTTIIPTTQKSVALPAKSNKRSLS